MPVTLVATAGAANANSYVTEAEVDAYFSARLPLVPLWIDAADPTASAAMATRLLDSLFMGRRMLRRCSDGEYVYVTSRMWKGTPATTTQRLAHPRIGLYDRNGNAVSSTSIHPDLKDATSELAGQLNIADITLDSSTITGGVTSVKAGSVAVTFRDNIEPYVLPTAVLNLLPPSWFYEEQIEPAQRALFDVVS